MLRVAILSFEMSTKETPIPTKTYLESPVPRVQTKGAASPKTAEAAASDLASKVPTSKAKLVSGHPGDPFVVIAPESLVESLKFLRDDANYLCQSLTVIAATDFLKQDTAEGQVAQEARIEVVYIVYSFRHQFQLTLKAILPRENPQISSIVSLYRAANWYERECYDMLGVTFEGHPNLKRILTSPDWVGHPLRKDYVFPEEYNGMKVPL